MRANDEASAKKALIARKDKWTEYISTLRGLSTAFLYTMCAVASASSVQLLEKKIPDFELNSFRCGTTFIIFLFGMITRRNFPTIERTEIVSTMLYSVLAFSAAMTWYTAVTFLPIASAQCIVQTTNITTGLCLFYFFLSDKVDIYVFISASICTGGVVLAIQPEFIFNNGESSSGVANNSLLNDETPDGNERIGSGHLPMQLLKYILPIVTGLVLTLDIVVLKRRPYLSQHVIEVIFWCFLLNTVFSIVLMLVFETPVLPNNWYEILLVGLHSLLYLPIWPLYMITVKYISGNTFNIITSSTVVFTLVTQYTVLSSVLPGNRNWIEFLGVVLVLIGSTLGSILELVRNKSKAWNDTENK